MVNIIAEENGYNYAEDGSMDLKGKPVIRSKTGKWRACAFIVVFELVERLAFNGVWANLVIYLSQRLNQGTVKASNNVNIWTGTWGMTPILGAYVADAFLGRYWTFIIAMAVFYLPGMMLLTLAVTLPGLRPPTCSGGASDCGKDASTLQEGIFFCALYMIALGVGGSKPSITALGADQFDEMEPKEKLQKLSFFNWWMFTIFFGSLFAQTFMIYVEDNVSYSVGYGILTTTLFIGAVVFLVGTPVYRHKPNMGSPITKIFQVVVASIRKWNVVVPDDSNELYELNSEYYLKSGNFKIDHTSSLRFLDKAAVKTGATSPWMVCPISQVEQTKQMLKLMPILLLTFIPSTLYSQVNTLFIKQATTLDRSIGPHFKIPPASLLAIVTIFMLTTIVFYDRFFVPRVRHYTRNPRGITMLQRMGTGFLIHVVVMVTASLVEWKRLSFARNHDLLSKNDMIPLSVFILVPQFALMGFGDNFTEIAKLEFFYDQAPEGMKSLGTALYNFSLGIGYFLGSFVLTTVSDVTGKHGRRSWVSNNLNVSHLDYYYVLLAVLGFVNFVLFLFVAKSFVYNKEKTKSDVVLSHEEDSTMEMVNSK